jgi:hypothetical protein
MVSLNYCRGFRGLWFPNLTWHELRAYWSCVAFCSINSIINKTHWVIFSSSISSFIIFFSCLIIIGYENTDNNLESPCMFYWTTYITPSSMLKAKPPFWRNTSPPSSGSKNNPSNNVHFKGSRETSGGFIRNKYRKTDSLFFYRYQRAASTSPQICKVHSWREYLSRKFWFIAVSQWSGNVVLCDTFSFLPVLEIWFHDTQPVAPVSPQGFVSNKKISCRTMFLVILYDLGSEEEFYLVEYNVV